MSRQDFVPESMQVIEDRFRYSPAVRAGDTLFIAGQVGRDADLNVVFGKEAQLVQAFENVKTALESGGADFDDVIEMVTYHTDTRDLELVIEVKDRYLKNRFPAWTAVGVTVLGTPGIEFEITCRAYLGDK